VLRGVRDRGDGLLERLAVGLRRRRRAADLAHVLQRGGVHLAARGGRLEVVQGADVAAHTATVTRLGRPAAMIAGSVQIRPDLAV
jgi:hypothetical protein